MNLPKLFTTLASGALFGAGLAISGMTNPQRVIGFLDVTGDWDPTLAFVMGGALGIFAVGLAILKRRGRCLFDCKLPNLSADPVSKPLINGSVLFGIGWGLSGFCPGPALANLSALRVEALVFTATMVCGMMLARRFANAH